MAKKTDLEANSVLRPLNMKSSAHYVLA